MRFKRVLLVNPAHHAEWRGLTPHIGQAYLAETLHNNGIEYDILDMNLGYGLKHLHQKLNHFQPDLVGMSLISMDYKRLYSLLGEIKNQDIKIRTVVGGPHVTILKEQVLRECPSIDYGITYEGEGALVELCRDEVAEGKIKGLLYRNDGDIMYSGDRGFIADLDQIPWPRYEKFEMNKYVPEITIYSSRGCPHKCIFCPNRILSPNFRPRSAENVGDELEYWYQRGYRQFNFDDDNFNMIQERIYAICDEIERRRLRRLFLRCSNGIRADRVDRDMLIRMREVGFRYIAFGADGGNNRVLEIVKKGETIEAIEDAVRNACELGYDVKLLFVVGTPHETWEDVEDKVRLSRKYPIQEVHFYNTIPYPGTELYDWVKENDYFLKNPEDYLNDISCLTNVPVFETPELPKKQRIELYEYLSRVRHNVHRDAIRRILQKHKLIGKIASPILANSIVERLFYQSRFWRKTIEYVRYKLALGNNAIS
ncbi:radical SAM protein [Candidatus Pacearchaeota archaeon]|nr:radical SAM protein [Candidatus Pacearchaeota archaeon]